MESPSLIHRIFLSLWVLLLPFWDLGAGVALVLAFFAAVLPNLSAARRRWSQSAPMWPLWGVVGMVGLGSLWHPTSLDAHLRLLPLIMVFWAYDQESIARSLPIGAIAVMGFLLGAGMLRVMEGAEWDTLVYRGLVKGLHQHVYIGTYLLLAALAVQNGPWSGRIKGFFWGMTLLFLGLLGAKMLLISALLGAGWAAFRDRRFPRWALPAVGILVLGFGLAQGLAQGRAMGHVFKPVDPHWATGSVDTRIVQVQAAWDLIQEKPWLGWGPESTQPALNARYAEMDYRFGVKRALNVHNQWVEWTLTYGLVGLGIWLVPAAMGFRVARPNPLGLGVFVLYFGSLWLTESFMERSLGVSLVAMAWMWGMVPKKGN